MVLQCVENIAGTKFEITLLLNEHSRLCHCPLKPLSGWCGRILALLVYSLYDIGLVVTSCIITTYFAPAAAGSGIPDVKVFSHQQKLVIAF